MKADAIQDRFEFASRLIDEAGELAFSYFHRLSSLTIKSKGVQDMASEADLNTELLIRDRLKAAFPEDAFFGEETGRAEVEGAPGLWVVDPIDGTQPFISGMSSWCVSIAFVADGKLKMGFVASPARRETFVGRCGRGSTLNGAPIQVRRGFETDRGHRRCRLFATSEAGRISADVRAPPQCGRNVLPRGLGRADFMFGRGWKAHRLRRAAHQFLRLPWRARGH